MDEILTTAIEELRFTRDDCLNHLDQLANLCPPDADKRYPEAFRMVSTPFLYSVWERCFTLTNAIAIRVIRQKAPTAGDCSSKQAALWLQKEAFFQSFLDKMRASAQADNSENGGQSKKIKGGAYKAVVELLEHMDQWREKPLLTGETRELVMTFSNVNPEVVQVNAEAIGINTFDAFKLLDFGRLHDLVGRRNDIGHGTLNLVPGNREFSELWAFTVSLVQAYSDAFERWLGSLDQSAANAD